MDMTKYVPDLEFLKHPVNGNSAMWIMKLLEGLIRRGPSAWTSLHPFIQKLWNAQIYFDDDCYLIIVHEAYHVSGSVYITDAVEPELISKAKLLINATPYPTIEQIVSAFGSDAFLVDKFTYTGKFTANKLSFHHLQDILLAYLDIYVMPEIWQINQQRVLSAIPVPPSYNVKLILKSIFIIESPQGLQGTCFNLAGHGLVTCEHSIREDSTVFRADELTKRYPVKILKRNETIDLAIFTADGLDLDEGLVSGESDSIQINDHIAVAGFPNHNYGDTGIFSPGLIVGFRMVSSIRRMLVNTPLIGGTSGGPILSYENKVIGVAVTGADKMENAALTENHGVIPISALNLL
ncbi:MAG TPA: serine protease [Pedobacter sp.]|uniref:S1 family peptidase n=1 Tax=Pedobacter sp. TaxID=1411316 RepID=UPI002BB79F69|nr:serine protease [Pedobacter sp.]HMI04870.1 serine protease [Pedobacter sp.]